MLEQSVHALYDRRVVTVSEVEVREEHVQRSRNVRMFVRNKIHLLRFVDFYRFPEELDLFGKILSTPDEHVVHFLVGVGEFLLVPVFVRPVRYF